MADASWAIGSFLGGELSQVAQGRFDKPDYRTSLKVCLNAFPIEIGAWTRRPGTVDAGATLNGLPGRVISFYLAQASAITLEFTDGFIRFRSGATMIAGPLATPFIGGSWASIRAVQAETTDILLCPTVAPQALTVTTPPGVSPSFALAPATFNDGPYLDPFTNGVQATPGSKLGIVTLQLSFPAYDAAKAYAVGSFVTSGGVNYVSLVDQNVGSAPPSANWATASASAAINGGKGFLGTDIGRLVRLFSEPPAWAVGTAYAASTAAAPVVVSYNPTGLPGATLYYQAAAASTGKVPGTDTTNWTLVPQGAAIWTWGKIVSLSNLIDRALAGSAGIGDMTSGGGLAGAFNGAFSQAAAASAEKSTGATSTGTVTLTSYVGKNYSGAADQKIQQATFYQSNDIGFAGGSNISISSITFNLRGKATAPASSSDGTLLGTTGGMANTFSAATIVSSDQTTAWKYVWIEQVTIASIVSGSGGPPGPIPYTLNNVVGQLSLFNPPGTGTGTGVNVEILGAPLLYTQPVPTWRLGVYSNTSGWPTCGVYHDGRLYLGGAVANRFDACVSNGIIGATVNFAPTDQYGAVAPNAAISYTFNANGVNPILWMTPDLQGVIMGTQAGEWLVQAPTAGPIAPANITARNVTNHGSANIQPCRTEHTTIFVQRFARKLLEYFPDVYSGKFSAPNLADKTARTRAGVAELAYTSAVTPIIWGRCNDGSWFGITYKRDSLASAQPPTFYGWHGHTLGSGRVVESICAGASVGGDLDALTMVTNDPATGIRRVEVLTDMQDELSPLVSAWFLDGAVKPSAVSSTSTGGAYGYGALTLTLSEHLNGKTVQVFAGGLDCGDPGEGKPISDFVPVNGLLTIPYGDGISAGPGRGLFTAEFITTIPQIVVGFTYNSDGQLVRPMLPADSGARNGPAFAKLTRGHRFGMKLVNTLGLLVGGDLAKKLYPAKFKTDGMKDWPALTSYSGVHAAELQDDYGYEGGSPAWRVSRPFPATVVIVGSNLATQDQ
jgi:hypothetical protein